jgi:NitT/TauT family transport system substrate-binding protein
LKRISTSFATVLMAMMMAACATPAAPPAAPAASAPAPAAPAAGSSAAAPTAPATFAPAAAPSPLAGGAPTTVRIGWRTAATSDAGILFAIERGYFQEQAIDVDFVTIASTPAMMAPLAQDQIEIATGGVNAALWNAVANDVPIKVVADKGSMTAPYQAFVVRSDLTDEIRDYPDLRGRKIAFNGTGTADHLALIKALNRGGLTEADVEGIAMPWTDYGLALSNRALDAGVGIEPFITRIVAQGIGTRWKGLDELSPGQQTAALYYGPQFAATDAATRFMVAYVRAARDYNDAFFKGIGRDEAVTMFMKHIQGIDRPLYDQMAMPGINPNGRVNQASIEEDLRAYLATGQVKQMVDVNKVVDNSFADAAVRALGGEYR